ncbi:PA14 domain-containing protein [Deminuibacter soli]|uniref:PA14 domain-containing protein n=1 Tax=Deminuibacter soli TaxID=2291815 RepID=UPI001314FFE9|nr:PA14 domain-containing protein [Deminuibacter soli]
MATIFYTETVLAAYVKTVDALGRSRAADHGWYGTAHKINSAKAKLASPQPFLTGDAASGRGGSQPAMPGKLKQPLKKYVFQPGSSGPSQPEMQSFQSVNGNNMVDLFTGDFSYNIPLLDVGGYPVNIAYKSGISMDQEASWVGLGWNINPGTITRNMRGLPDDFKGNTDTIRKIMHVSDDVTIGVSGEKDMEIFGKSWLLQKAGLSILNPKAGIFHNSRTGWGVEGGVNVNIDAAKVTKGPMTTNLSIGITDNSQTGLTIQPSFSMFIDKHAKNDRLIYGGQFGSSFSYNSRTGIRGLQLNTNSAFQNTLKNGKFSTYSSGPFGANISFSSPAFTPTISMPYNSLMATVKLKFGTEDHGLFNNAFISGYYTRSGIADEDTALALPAYGYLNFQGSNRNRSALLDMNREKEIPYRESPQIPNLAVPSYTYDVFSVTGEGIGGMFRPYRGDIGFVYDHAIRTKDASGGITVELGAKGLAHYGVDIDLNRSYTQNGPWLNNNTMANTIGFQDPHGLFEASYFRNPGEKAINSADFYKAIGGDDVVTVNLQQNGSNITAASSLNRYHNNDFVENINLTPQNATKQTRDKRTQVITYLTAAEASVTGLSRYIDLYTPNKFDFGGCAPVPLPPDQNGIKGEYFTDANFQGHQYTRQDQSLFFDKKSQLQPEPGWSNDHFSARWHARLLAPVSGKYKLFLFDDDAMKLWLNDSLVINDTRDHGEATSTCEINLVGGVYYNLYAEYGQNKNDAWAQLQWIYPGGPNEHKPIPAKYFFVPDETSYYELDATRAKEKRVNAFRKENHLSEVDVVNTDGRRYVYGIPVYNLKQKEVSFSVFDPSKGTPATGLTAYGYNADGSVDYGKGNPRAYYSREEIPAYAHSFLLTGILSPDYVDLTGNGISEDDPGDAIKFNYSRIRSITNPYAWRAPFSDSATFNEGMKTDNSDNKANYVYGEKELWYMHSIESKNMVATFTTEDRKDGLAIDERGNKTDGGARRLKQIDLYTKADLIRNGAQATPVKTVHFAYSYKLCRGYNSTPANRGYDTGKLTLDSIWFTYNGNDKGKRNPYVFKYHSNNPRYATSGNDRWGSYKNALQNPGSVSGNIISNAEYPYSIQDSAIAAANAAAWTLNQVKLPSGGSINVDYESDDYAYVQNKRAASMLKVVGCAVAPGQGMSNSLYGSNGDEAKYFYVRVSSPVSGRDEVFDKYLRDIDKLYFRMNVAMPSDSYGSGSEYVSVYADIDKTYYEMVTSSLICIKVMGINSEGDDVGDKSPVAKAALNFLRLNLPSKAYPGSDFADGASWDNAIKTAYSMITNITNMFSSYEGQAKRRGWARSFDTTRSFVRLNSPDYKKYGGGLRVKRVTITDNWNAMTKQKESGYGQEYTYTTTTMVNGKPLTISSGVACWEPMIGGDENPFHLPLEYDKKISPLAPTEMGYTELPLGESFYPGASVGYSKVRVRSIHAKNIRSANGYEESSFYTAYDFPVKTEMTQLDGLNKKRYKPLLASLLHVNAKYYIGLSQGFKVELNDMHGKPRSQATYAETDPANPISYTETFYKTDNLQVPQKHLANTVWTINQAGKIDTTTTIGKDIELMVDMREQQSVTHASSIPINGDVFKIPVPPYIFLVPTILGLAQSEDNLFHSAVTTKVIQRYGLVDSVVAIDKGSRVTTQNLLYNSETGDVLLTKTINEFNDPIYNFTYPADWAYDGMGGAYKNVNAIATNLKLKDGKIVGGITTPGEDTTFFASGDELLAYSKPSTARTVDSCNDEFAAFPTVTRLWAINANELAGGKKNIYFIDENGVPFSGNDVTLKVTRSGRRNISAAAGSVTTLRHPLVKQAGGDYQLILDESSKVLTASAAEYRELWQVTEPHKQRSVKNCVPVAVDNGSGANSNCNCLTPLFSYLIQSGDLYANKYDGLTVNDMISRANSSGYAVSAACPILAVNLDKPFYAKTFETSASDYQAQIGDCIVSIAMKTDARYDFRSLTPVGCASTPGVVNLKYNFSTRPATKRLHVTKNMEHEFSNTFDVMKLRAGTLTTAPASTVSTYFKFEDLPVSSADALLSATMHLFAAREGFNPPQIGTASTPVKYADPDFLRLSIPVKDWTKDGVTDTAAHSWYEFAYNAIRPNNYYYNYTTDVTAALKQQYFTSGLGNTGFSIKDNQDCLPQPSTRYVAFASNLFPDITTKPYLEVTYNLPHDPSEVVATLQVLSCEHCENTTAQECYNPVMDTAVNPYNYGLLGVYRANKSYTYFSNRAQSDPQSATNIRTDGAFRDFVPFWTFGANGIFPQYDTTRWVWNSELTKFNTKGFEIENVDALGRYNAGLYGYNTTLPVAVIQNARYNESVFEGFEDYDFNQGSCETLCAASRHVDFSAVKSKITSEQAHTGKYSIAVNPNDAVGISATVYPADTTAVLGLNIETKNTACSEMGPVLSSIRSNGGVLLPVFSPLAGRQILVSGWSRESPDGVYKTYTHSQIGVSFTVNGSSVSQALLPQGTIIDGWQRYEGVFTVPGNATNFAINLMATGSSKVFFDDIRIHPYNANMKSFVYDPVTLRLVSELDENNYATFYEYDDDGTLIRVKKETERGIKTIKETRSALLKAEAVN